MLHCSQEASTGWTRNSWGVSVTTRADVPLSRVRRGRSGGERKRAALRTPNAPNLSREGSTCRDNRQHGGRPACGRRVAVEAGGSYAARGGDSESGRPAAEEGCERD